jgi:hypothetical protein
MRKYQIVACIPEQAFWNGKNFDWEPEKARLYTYRKSALKNLNKLLETNPAIILQEVKDA